MVGELLRARRRCCLCTQRQGVRGGEHRQARLVRAEVRSGLQAVPGPSLNDPSLFLAVPLPEHPWAVPYALVGALACPPHNLLSSARVPGCATLRRRQGRNLSMASKGSNQDRKSTTSRHRQTLMRCVRSCSITTPSSKRQKSTSRWRVPRLLTLRRGALSWTRSILPLPLTLPRTTRSRHCRQCEKVRTGLA